MPENEQMTHVEHFVSQTYLRQFSENKKSLYRYDVNHLDKPPKTRSINRICREIDLYELFDQQGAYIAPNLIEDFFGKLETKIGRIIKSIIEKAESGKYLNCVSFLSEDDKTHLIIFMTALKYRNPQTIESGIRILQQSNPDMDIREARNFTLLNLLPLSGDPEWDKNTIIRTSLKSYCGMAFQIGLANEDVIFTSDRPVIEWPPDNEELYNRPKAVVFPLTSRIILYLYPRESVDPNCINCFFALNNERIIDLQHNVAATAREWIFTKKPLSVEQMEKVKEARKRLQTSDPSQ